MDIINSIINYRRYLKRRNCAKGTVKIFMNSLKNFVIWVNVPIEEVTNQEILAYIDYLLDLTHLNKILKIYPDVEEAISSFREQ